MKKLMYNERITTIKHWPTEERPREKFILESGTSLSNAELIAILIGSGNSDESAVALGKRILDSMDGDLGRLAELSIRDLSRFKGIGMAKAVSVAAAVELCYKRMYQTANNKCTVGSSASMYQMIKEELAGADLSSWWLFIFNPSGLLIEKRHLGRIQGEPRAILNFIIEQHSSSFLLVHLCATEYEFATKEDKDCLTALLQSADMLDLTLHDQIVIHPNGYFSFKDANLI